MLSASIAFPALAIITLALLIPYIGHYYTLENEVHRLYIQYDRLCDKCREQNHTEGSL